MSTNAADPTPQPAPKRRYPRFTLDIRLRLEVFRSGTTQSFWGRSRELGQDGIGGTFTGELEPGEVVSLDFTLPIATKPIKIRAIVRYRKGLYHGFEFLTLTGDQRGMVQRACDFLSANG